MRCLKNQKYCLAHTLSEHLPQSMRISVLWQIRMFYYFNYHSVRFAAAKNSKTRTQWWCWWKTARISNKTFIIKLCFSVIFCLCIIWIINVIIAYQSIWITIFKKNINTHQCLSFVSRTTQNRQAMYILHNLFKLFFYINSMHNKWLVFVNEMGVKWKMILFLYRLDTRTRIN